MYEHLNYGLGPRMMIWEPWMGKPPVMEPKFPVLYLMRCGEGWKIGVAANPSERRRTLQIGNPNPIELVAVLCHPHKAFLIEQTIHQLLKPWNIHGEWVKAPINIIIGAIKCAWTKYAKPQVFERWQRLKLKHDLGRLGALRLDFNGSDLISSEV